MTLYKLPLEILAEISRHLTAQELARCAELSRAGKAFFESDINWQHRVKTIAIIDYAKDDKRSWKQVYLEHCARLPKLAKQLYQALSDPWELLDFGFKQIYCLHETKSEVLSVMARIVPQAITTPALIHEFLKLPSNTISEDYRLGYNLLHWFTAYGDAEGVKYLLARGCPIKETPYEEPLIALAVQRCHNMSDYAKYEKVIRVLAEQAPTLVISRDSAGYTILERLKALPPGCFLFQNKCPLNEYRHLLETFNLLIALGADKSVLTPKEQHLLQTWQNPKENNSYRYKPY